MSNARTTRTAIIAGFVALSAVASLTASAQTRTRAAAAEAVVVETGGEGSGEAVQERAYDPRSNEAAQPEPSEGNEDERDINSGDDGNGGSESQGGN